MKTSIRSFATLLLTFSFIILALSGICLYVAPQCKVAEEIAWRMLGLEKGQWESIHMTSALIFFVLAGIHLLVYNWKLFCCIFEAQGEPDTLHAPGTALLFVGCYDTFDRGRIDCATL